MILMLLLLKLSERYSMNYKCDIARIRCYIDVNDSLSLDLYNSIESVLKEFNIESVIIAARGLTRFIPINKDGDTPIKITYISEKKYSLLGNHHKKLYIILLSGRILRHIDDDLFDHYNSSYFTDDIYVNILLQSYIETFQLHKRKQAAFDHVETITKGLSQHVAQTRLPLSINEITLTVSDDLYRYICAQSKQMPCKGLKAPYTNTTLYDIAITIEVRKSRYADFFSLSINGLEAYMNTIEIGTTLVFDKNTNLKNPIKTKQWYPSLFQSQEMIDKHNIYEIQDFIRLLLNRIMQINVLLQNDMSHNYLQHELKRIS